MRQMVIPMRQELVRSGFEELTTEEAVTEFIENTTGTTLVVVKLCLWFVQLVCLRPSAGQAVVRAGKTT
ncbi:BrxA/BrxB family bacilliredoxin [Bacillus pacificus]